MELLGFQVDYDKDWYCHWDSFWQICLFVIIKGFFLFLLFLVFFFFLLFISVEIIFLIFFYISNIILTFLIHFSELILFGEFHQEIVLTFLEFFGCFGFLFSLVFFMFKIYESLFYLLKNPIEIWTSFRNLFSLKGSKNSLCKKIFGF